MDTARSRKGRVLLEMDQVNLWSRWLAVPSTSLHLAFLTLLFSLAQGEKQQVSEHWKWNFREGVFAVVYFLVSLCFCPADRVNINGVGSITRLLNQWGNRIFKQVKDTVLSKPQDVLPDYSRIQPFSEALDDLFREAQALKKRLGDLTESLAGLERAVIKVGYGNPVKIKHVVTRKVPRKQTGHQNSHHPSPHIQSRNTVRRRPAVRRQSIVSNRERSRVNGQ
ncbi:uncharacterized protein [Narcine bancroftii]|uniref:uncharacterized protein n=1 Tax=Narcine bancroftii TaxID=1343680 RepID=UPI0038316D45